MRRKLSVVVVMLASCASDLPCDGVIDLGEQCDDGNGDPFDGCDCVAQPPWSAPLGDRTAEGFIVLEEDGAWCWFQDERVVVAGNRLIASSMSHAGDVQVSSYDLATGARDHGVIRRGLERDDHDAAGLHLRADGRLTAFYTRHDGDPAMYWRTQAGPSLGTWGAEQRFEIDDDITYSNPIELADGIHLFFRGHDYNPTVASSTDGGDSWSDPRQLIHSYTRSGGSRVDQRPYVKFASNGEDTVHLLFTDGHPNELPATSIYHLIYRDGALFRSDGTRVEEGTPQPQAGTEVHDGKRDGSAWIWDAALDGEQPVAVFATVREGVHEYHYARWDGAWQVAPIAGGGRPIYPDEQFYSGGIAIDPDDPRIVYFASTADPITHTSTPHFELYRGITEDGGQSWTFRALTTGSSVDNLRPTVPAHHWTATAVVWLQGTYQSYFDYDTRVVALLGAEDAIVPAPAPHAELERLARLDVATAAVDDGRMRATDGDLTFEIWNARLESNGEITGIARGDSRMHVRVHGLAPATRYVARIHAALPSTDRAEPTLWFVAGTDDSEVRSPAFLGAHRPGNSAHGGDAAVDLAISSDDLGRVELIALAMDEGARTRMSAIEILARPATEELARFDLDVHPDVGTAPGFVSVAPDVGGFESTATHGEITITARADRRGYTTGRDDSMLAEADALLGANQLVLDVAGLVPGEIYEITVLTSDLDEDHQYHAARWRLEEAGAQPRVVAGFQMNAGGLGPSNSFSFVHAAASEVVRLRATDIYWNRSTEPSVVILSGVVVRKVVAP